jgi:hypothetical protein
MSAVAGWCPTHFPDSDAAAVIAMAMGVLTGYLLAGMAPTLLWGAGIVYAAVAGYGRVRNLTTAATNG